MVLVRSNRSRIGAIATIADIMGMGTDTGSAHTPSIRRASIIAGITIEAGISQEFGAPYRHVDIGDIEFNPEPALTRFVGHR
jgi:hypothetical protein